MTVKPVNFDGINTVCEFADDDLKHIQDHVGEFPVLPIKLYDDNGVPGDKFYVVMIIDEFGGIHAKVIPDNSQHLQKYADKRGISYQEAVREVMSVKVFNTLRNVLLKAIDFSDIPCKEDI